MALYKSTWLTNASATPNVRENYGMGHAFTRGESFSMTTDHDTADVILLFPLPSNTVVNKVLMSTDGAATAGAGDIGLYTLNVAMDTATEVDKDLFASAQAITSAGVDTDVTGESTTVTIDERYKPLWEVLGLSEDPGAVYWLGWTITTDVDATTVTSLRVEGWQ